MTSTKPVFSPVPPSAVTRKLDQLNTLLDTATVTLENGERGLDIRKLGTEDATLNAIVSMFKDGFTVSTGGIPFLTGEQLATARTTIEKAKAQIVRAAGDDATIDLNEAHRVAQSVVPRMIRDQSLPANEHTNAEALASVAMQQVTASYDSALKDWTTLVASAERQVGAREALDDRLTRLATSVAETPSGAKAVLMKLRESVLDGTLRDAHTADQSLWKLETGWSRLLPYVIAATFGYTQSNLSDNELKKAFKTDDLVVFGANLETAVKPKHDAWLRGADIVGADQIKTEGFQSAHPRGR